MTPIEIIGLLGIIAVAISWVPQTIAVFKEKKAHLELKFILIYSAGSILLLAYSILVVDWIYITLNCITTVLAGINLYFALRN